MDSRKDKSKTSNTKKACNFSSAISSNESVQSEDPSPTKSQVASAAQGAIEESSPLKDGHVTVENCGVLTINNHKFAVEYKHLIKKYGETKLMANQKTNQSLQGSASDIVSICTSNTRYKVVGEVACKMGWRCTRVHDTCNVLWTDSMMGADTCRLIRRYQKINHFPGMFEICRKDLLARNMNRMFKMFPNDYDIFPKTWHLPADYGEAIQYSRQFRNKTYILKPDQGAQGRGIWLTKSLKTISPTDHMICQLYIPKPLLIDGFKFDLRVYALITSIDPLRIYVFNEGLVRFATSPYQAPKGHNTTNMYMHLTNYSVNKHSRTYSKDNEMGSKRKFSTFNRLLSAEGYDVVTLWNNIDDVVIKTILSAWPVMRHNYNTSFPTHDFMSACFEILGVDIIIDQNMKPWLLEVNHSPSFHTDGPVDTEVKHALIRDTFTMLNIRSSDKRRIMEEDKKRITARLLKRIYESGDPATQTSKTNCAQLMSQDKIQKQIKWEETHMGGYRCVYPVPGDLTKYINYMEDQGQTSVYSNTFTSKRREEASKIQRILIAEKERFPIPVKSFNKNSTSTNEAAPEKQKRRYPKAAVFCDGYGIEIVSDSEERGRTHLMNQRHFLVESCGVIKYILYGFYRNGLLTQHDLSKYDSLNDVLTESNFDSFTQERQLLMKSMSATGSNSIFM